MWMDSGAATTRGLYEGRRKAHTTSHHTQHHSPTPERKGTSYCVQPPILCMPTSSLYTCTHTWHSPTMRSTYPGPASCSACLSTGTTCAQATTTRQEGKQNTVALTMNSTNRKRRLVGGACPWPICCWGAGVSAMLELGVHGVHGDMHGTRPTCLMIHLADASIPRCAYPSTTCCPPSHPCTTTWCGLVAPAGHGSTQQQLQRRTMGPNTTATTSDTGWAWSLCNVNHQ